MKNLEKEMKECILTNEEQLFSSIFIHMKKGPIKNYYDIG